MINGMDTVNYLLLKTIKGIPLRNKKVLLRVDFNVFVEGSKITDDFRIKRSLPTIKYLIKDNQYD